MLRTLIGSLAVLLLPVAAHAGGPIPEVTAFRLSPSDGWAPGRQPPKQPLLDVPTHLLGSPPEVVADLYWNSLSRGNDGRTVAGTVPLRLTAAEIGGAADQTWGAQLSLLGNDAWPEMVLLLARTSGETSFDPVLQLSRVQNANDPQVVLYYTDPSASDFVWIRCFFRDVSRIGPQGDGTCWLKLSAVANVATGVEFPAVELPQWRPRADHLRALTLAWARSSDEWPPTQGSGETELLDTGR